MSDAVRDKDVYRRLAFLESEHEAVVRGVRKQLDTAERGRDELGPRWAAGDAIEKYSHRIRHEMGFYVTNLPLALATGTMVSEKTIRILVKFRRRMGKPRAGARSPRWSLVREALDIGNEEQFQRCVKLLASGKLSSARQVRLFHKSGKA